MLEALLDFAYSTGFPGLDWRVFTMMAIAFVLLYLAIVHQFEPLLLVPIAFGVILTNLPSAGLMSPPVLEITEHTFHTQEPGGLLYYLFLGDELGIFPPLIFLGVGAMTDFGPLIANPRALLLGAAAQFGIFITFIGAIASGLFNAQQAAAIGIIGGADGPTAIFLSSKLAPELMGAIAVAAYSYMALVPIIQPPIMKLLTTKKERGIKMSQLRTVTQREKIFFPIIVTIVVSLIVPPAATLVGMLMLGNLFRECGVVARLEDTAKNALINIITIFLGVTVGATATAENFLQVETLSILGLGIVAFAIGTASGVLLAKLMNITLGTGINPLIGSAGVSAVPMAARVSQVVGSKEDPTNFLLMHAMGPNVAGVIGSAVTAGVFLSMFGS
ncbi:MAG TPA: sodium ion-translocating decarboxylase subunit beta [Chromatiaceae bacterium]|jgi:sodium ion-translocating decarboxylase beta subunit|nr:MAG: glutaconyl-CoA decarboxylase subunit beta [Thiohalocapsa sp. PB-PSB1]QQO52869.1 MAG: sodium ion-translocating decarboxylase subunit beta [Thiohalocapsa sp. PB-PSB1]HBG96480.1 sodium ion-translocating decarboxylase subunit beta [Chromatiaceae bacterium]HCS88527.1 sodium ion-translocating decarboxylase subunit beta [Chromatiaceae bacterium]